MDLDAGIVFVRVSNSHDPILVIMLSEKEKCEKVYILPEAVHRMFMTHNMSEIIPNKRNKKTTLK